MRRRTFLALVGGAAAAPFAARAQQPAKMRRVVIASGWTPVSELTEARNPRYRSMFAELRKLGHVEGQNLIVERISFGGQTERFAELAREVVRSEPDLIFTASSPMVRAFLAASDRIPIVFNASDPVALGLVAGLARPGGNATGVTTDAGFELFGKRLDLIRQVLPAASRMAVLGSRFFWTGPLGEAVRTEASRLAIELVPAILADPIEPPEYRRVFAALDRGVAAMYVANSAENFLYLPLIAELALAARLPTIFPFPEAGEVGGLVSYGVELADLYRRAARQMHLILAGADPGQLPIYRAEVFKLVVNLKTAEALAVKIPPAVLVSADEVIE